MSTILDAQFLRSHRHPAQLLIDLTQPLRRDLYELILLLLDRVLSEVGQVQDNAVHQRGHFLLLVLEVLAQVLEVTVFEVGVLDQFGDDDGHLCACHIVVVLLDQLVNDQVLFLSENDVVELEVVYRLVDLLIQHLHLFLRRGKIIRNHLFQE